jgi:hypothetical protein
VKALTHASGPLFSDKDARQLEIQIRGIVSASAFFEYEFILGIRQRGLIMSLAPAAAGKFKER